MILITTGHITQTDILIFITEPVHFCTCLCTFFGAENLPLFLTETSATCAQKTFKNDI